MQKKHLSGLDALIPDNKPDSAPINHDTPKTPLQAAKVELRITTIVDKQIWGDINAIAYWDRLKLKSVVNDAFSEYIKRYKSKNGELKTVPANADL